MTGELTITSIHAKTQQEAILRRTKNLFVDTGYDEVAMLLAGDDAEDHFASRMQFGTGDAAPDDSDVSLAMPITPIKDIITITDPDVDEPFRVILEAYLLADEGNGFPLNEAGLLSEDDALIARAIYTEITKDSDHIFRFTWQINS